MPDIVALVHSELDKLKAFFVSRFDQGTVADVDKAIEDTKKAVADAAPVVGDIEQVVTDAEHVVSDVEHPQTPAV